MERSGNTLWIVLCLGLLAGGAAPRPGNAAVLFQAAGSNFQQTNPDGLVVMEAESFQSNTSQGGHDWTTTTAYAGFSGSAAMRVTPDNGGFQDTGTFVANSPRLNFSVNFIATGTHYVWVRGWAPVGGTDDSVHVGLDGAEVATADRLTGWGGAYSWHKNTMDNVDATLNIATAGVHVINVWMREDGFVCDKILITTNAGYTPTGTGPAESAKLPAPTNVQAVGGYDRVTLTWAAVTGATSYQIFRSQNPAGPFDPPAIATVNAPATTYVDNDAAYGSTYYYVVRAVSAAGTSGNSTPPAAGVPLQPPVKVTPISGLQTSENLTSTSFTITYTIPAPAGGSLLTVTSSNTLEGTVAANNLVTNTVAGGFSYTVPAGQSPTIVVTVTGVDDVFVDGNRPYTVNITASNIAVPVTPVSLTNNDNDIQGLTFTRTSGLITSESGGQSQFTVYLNRAPYGNVAFDLVSSNVLEGTVLPGRLTFTPTGGDPYSPATGFGGWNVGHEVTVTGVDDALLDFTIPYSINTSALTFADVRDQAAFTAAGATAVPDVGCLNLDNEIPPELPAVWGGSGCGLLGLEALPLLAVLGLLRRRKISAP